MGVKEKRTDSIRMVTLLEHDWTFRQSDHPDSKVFCTAGFPTEIFKDLLFHKLIPDPFLEQHEQDVQWVGEKAWIYQTSFYFRNSEGRKAVLVFEGLDTYATVHLNETVILRSSNMFTPFRVGLDPTLLNEGSNNLSIRFESAFLIGKKIMEKHPQHHWGCSNGDISRLAVRKAQYHYGWDWGPTLLTCGPWKPIYLETFESRISDLSFTTHIDQSLKSAEIRARVEFEGDIDRVILELSFEGVCVARGDILNRLGSTEAETVLRTNNPRLWFPRKYGEQPLYVLSAQIIQGDRVLDARSKRFGLRKAEIIQRSLENEPGTNFTFEVNNIPIFCGGSNWIPTHSFQTILKDEDYRSWIRMAASGNHFMLRVWGGGIYEQDAFYDACDELGILVWQDFMFACGNYPAFETFLNSIREEATSNVKRLRHHPCIVLWAGNNEDYQYRESANLDYDPDDRNPENWLKSSFPARYIYEKLLPDIMQSLAPDTYYHFGSPYGGRSSGDPTIGDIHQWNMWHGTQEKYQDLDKLSGRFVSEFGMEAYPDQRTLDGILANGANDIERYAQSSTIEFHNKAAGNERRLALYLAENIRYTIDPFPRYIYCTQLIQSEAISSAFRLWKRLWKGPGRQYCSGALVWQLNDCWPTISWSLVDHFLRPKLGYFALKREMEPVTIGMKRTVRKHPKDKHTGAYIATSYELEIWACNLSLHDLRVEVSITSRQFMANQTPNGPAITVTQGDIFRDVELKSVRLPANCSTEVTSITVPANDPVEQQEADQTIVSAVIRASYSGEVLARSINWPEPLKHVHLPRPKSISLKLTKPSTEQEIAQVQQIRQEWRKCSNPSDTQPRDPKILLLHSDVPLKCVQWDLDAFDDRVEAHVEQSDHNQESNKSLKYMTKNVDYQGKKQRIQHPKFDDEGFDVMMGETIRVLVWNLKDEDLDKVKLRYL